MAKLNRTTVTAEAPGAEYVGEVNGEAPVAPDTSDINSDDYDPETIDDGTDVTSTRPEDTDTETIDYGPPAPEVAEKVTVATRRDLAAAAFIAAANGADHDVIAIARLFAAVPAGHLDAVSGNLTSALFPPADGDFTAAGIRAGEIAELRGLVSDAMDTLGARPSNVSHVLDPAAVRAALVARVGTLSAIAAHLADANAYAALMVDAADPGDLTADEMIIVTAATVPESVSNLTAKLATAIGRVNDPSTTRTPRTPNTDGTTSEKADSKAADMFVPGTSWVSKPTRAEPGIVHRAVVEIDGSWTVTDGRDGHVHHNVTAKRGTPSSPAAKLVNGNVETSGPRYWLPAT